MGVEEGLLFYGIALSSGGVSPGNVEFAAAVEADFADSSLAFGDGTAMPAGEAAQAMVFQVLDQARVSLADLRVEDCAEGRTPYVYSNAARDTIAGSNAVLITPGRVGGGSWEQGIPSTASPSASWAATSLRMTTG